MDTLEQSVYTVFRDFRRERAFVVKAPKTDWDWGFSYLRYSRGEQEEGDSVRRQTALRDAWLDRHPNVRLDESLRRLDPGVSAFRGKHRSDPKYALAAFEEEVRQGRVPVGSYLIVENLDRLTRENPVTSVPAVLNLIAAGIRVVQLVPVEMVYDADMEQHHLMNMLWELARGHGDSKRKSGMLSEVWRAKKRDARSGKPIGKQVPKWIELTDGVYRIREEAGKAVRQIFRLSAKGMGSFAITNKLNEDGVAPIGTAKKWVRSYVAKILRSRACIGEYQPKTADKKRTHDGEPIPNYFPAVVKEREFYAAQSAAKSRAGRSGRPADDQTETHPFGGLLRCAVYQCAIYTVKRGEKRYLVSARAAEQEPGVRYMPFPLVPFREALLEQMEELKATELFADPGSARVAELEGRLADVGRRLAAALVAFEADPESPTWSAKVTQYDREKRSLVREQKEAVAEARTPLPALWVNAVKLIAENEPQRLRAVLLQVIDSIHCVFAKVGVDRTAAVQVFFKGGESRLYAIYWTRMVTLPGRQKPDKWSVRSLTTGPGDKPIDLRKPKDAKRMEKWLSQGDD